MSDTLRQHVRWIAWLFMCLLAVTQCAHAAGPAPTPESTGLIVDQANVLSDDAHAALKSRLKAIQSSGRAQVAILISSGIAGEPLSDYSLRVAEAWQLGRARRDDGLLILVVPATNAARIEVGYGLEGAIPDARASQWIDELIPAIKKGELAAGLNHLLDGIEAVLPAAAAKKSANDGNYLFPDHPEWRLPFVLVIFSLFSLFPLMMGRWGSIASAFMLAAFYGGAAWALRDSRNAGLAAAAMAFPLPLLWGLNWIDSERLPRALRYAKTFGNLCGVMMFFAIITLFVGVGLWAGGAQEVWAAPIFSGFLALGLAAFLFPDAQRTLMVVLRSVGHFVMILTIAYLGLQPFAPNPTGIAFAVAGAFTALIALALYLDAREKSRAGATRWSLWLIGIALLIALPFGLMLLAQAVLGEDPGAQLTQMAAGGGSVGGILWLAARFGFFAAVSVGLGGRFGGGGAGRGD
jgi:uncharacterized protein